MNPKVHHFPIQYMFLFPSRYILLRLLTVVSYLRYFLSHAKSQSSHP